MEAGTKRTQRMLQRWGRQGAIAAQGGELGAHSDSEGNAAYQSQPNSPSEASGLPDSPGGELLQTGDSKAAGTDGSAPRQPFILQDSEEQEDLVQPTRPRSGTQRAILLLDSEEQEGLDQPDAWASPRQRFIAIPDSEEQDDALLPGGSPAPYEPAAEASDGRVGEIKGCASEGPPEAPAADMDTSRGDHNRKQKLQTEAEFEANIAHLPPARQRELRELHTPWARDR